MPETINDLLLAGLKSMQTNIPFPSAGGGWGASQLFHSEASWDSWIDGQSTNNVERYRKLVGDLSHNSLIMAAVRFLGDAIPEAPLCVKKRATDKDGQKQEAVIMPDHPVSKLWKRPNEFYSGSTLKRAIAFSLVLASNAYVIKNFNKVNTKPLELWWEPHWTIRPIWAVDGSNFIQNYQVNRNGQWYDIPVENIIHIRDGIHPYNQRLGLSGNDSILRELYGDEEAANYYATLMGGAGIPGIAISIDKERKIDQPKLDALEKRIVEKTSGSRKGQPLVLYGARPYKMGLNPRELDLRETRYTAEDRFCATQGIPAVVLELGTGQDHSIYNNVKQAMERAWRGYVCPKLTMIEEELDVQLLEDFEKKDSAYYCEHDLSEVQALQEDQDQKASRLNLLYNGGSIMKSEVRSGMGFGPSDPADPDKDKVFSVNGTLVMAGEQPLPSGEQIVDMKTGKVVRGAPPAPPPASPPMDAGAGEQAPTSEEPADLLKTVKAMTVGEGNKALPNGKQLLTPKDVQATISFLKKHRFDKAAGMMMARTAVKKPNGNSKILG